jgi:hypothetical protein
MATKTYPFSGTKHAHDIEFRRNRCFNLMHDMEVGTAPWSEAEYDRLQDLHDKLTDLLLCMHEGVCQVPGRLYGLAKETVLWAAEARATTAGRHRREAR